MHRKVDGGRTRTAKAPTYLPLSREKNKKRLELFPYVVLMIKKIMHTNHTHMILYLYYLIKINK